MATITKLKKTNTIEGRIASKDFSYRMLKDNLGLTLYDIIDEEGKCHSLGLTCDTIYKEENHTLAESCFARDKQYPEVGDIVKVDVSEKIITHVYNIDNKYSKVKKLNGFEIVKRSPLFLNFTYYFSLQFSCNLLVLYQL